MRLDRSRGCPGSILPAAVRSISGGPMCPDWGIWRSPRPFFLALDRRRAGAWVAVPRSKLIRFPDRRSVVMMRVVHRDRDAAPVAGRAHPFRPVFPRNVGRVPDFVIDAA